MASKVHGMAAAKWQLGECPHDVLAGVHAYLLIRHAWQLLHTARSPVPNPVTQCLLLTSAELSRQLCYVQVLLLLLLLHAAGKCLKSSI